MSVSSTELSKHDLAVWIASAIGMIGQRRMSPVAIVGGGDRETRVEPSLARNDLWHVIEPLRTGAFGETTRLGERLRALAARIDRSSVIVVVSDMHDPAALPARCVARLRHTIASPFTFKTPPRKVGSAAIFVRKWHGKPRPDRRCSSVPARAGPLPIRFDLNLAFALAWTISAFAPTNPSCPLCDTSFPAAAG